MFHANSNIASNASINSIRLALAGEEDEKDAGDDGDDK